VGWVDDVHEIKRRGDEKKAINNREMNKEI
jgi:hypothetical protein